MLLNQMLGELRGLMDEGIAVEIGSMPGAGKSEGTKAWAHEQSVKDGFEWGVSTVMLATQTPVDLLGFMLPARRQIKDPVTGEMSTARISEFSRPMWTM